MIYASDLEIYMLELINAERTSRGLTPLKLEVNLNQSAEEHSIWMLDTNTFSHTGQGNSSAGQRMREAGFDFSGSSSSAENIAIQSARGAAGYQDDVANLHTSLMNSSGHRANILNPGLEYIGIGIEVGSYTYSGGFTGTSVIVTQNFGRTQGSVDLDDLRGDSGGTGSGPTNRSDLLRGNSGNEMINGLDGADTIFGSSGHDTLMGGNQNDRLWGETGKDRLDGGSGNDVLKGGSNKDVLRGSSGNDKLFGGTGNDKLTGGKGNDQLYGQAGSDTFIFGPGTGNDRIKGGFDVDGGATDKIRINNILDADDVDIRIVGGDTIFDYGNSSVVIEGFSSNIEGWDHEVVNGGIEFLYESIA